MNRHPWKRAGILRAASTSIIAIALMSSALVLGVANEAIAASAVSVAPTFPVNTQSLGGTTITVNPQKVGDLIIFDSQIGSQSITVTGVSCPKTGAWHLAKRYLDTVNHAITEEMWWAVATSTGSTQITPTYSASVASLSPELVSDSFTTSSPSTWSLVGANGAAAAATTSISFPSVTSGASAPQVYWGYAESTQTALSGSTAGFTYSSTAEGNLITSDVALGSNTAYAPTARETPVSNNTSIGAIFAAAPAVTTYTVTFNGNGSTSGSMSPETASAPSALSLNTFARTGYTFAGWNSAANGTGTSYADGASYPFSASTTLYAQWSPNSHPVTTTLSTEGTFVTAGGNGLTTAKVSLGKSGDLLVIWVKARFSTTLIPIQVASISASGTGAIGTPVLAIQHYTVDHPNNDDEIWFAPITTAGSITLTFTWTGSISSDYLEYSTQEFQPSAPSTYSLDTGGYFEGATASLTMQFPSLTPAGAGELYAGYDSNNTSGTYTSPITPGYTQDYSSNFDAILFDPDVSALTQSPYTTANANPSAQSSVGALIVATADS